MADLAAIESFLAEPRNVMVAGIRKDGRPAMTPNWFVWEDGRFLISTTKDRAKYRIFSRDARVQLAVDDATAFRCAIIDGTVEIWDDVDAALPSFRAIRAKHGRKATSDEELRAELVRDKRVVLVVTPDRPMAEWVTIGL